MSPLRDPQQIIQAERLALCALCQGTREGSVREAGRQILRDYRWREPLHGVVYEIVMSLPADSPAILRDQLPTRLTRRGFPHVAWEDFFEPNSLSTQEVEQIMRELCDSVRQ